MKDFFRKTGWVFIITGIIILLDQITKILVRTYILPGSFWSPWSWLSPYARIIHLTNTGVAFGMFQGMNYFFAGLAAVVAGAIIFYIPKIDEKEKLIRFALAMELGGAIGNLIDRLTVGQVTDFVSLGNFAVFNVADSCITLGVGVLLIGVWLQEKREKKQKEAILDENTPDSMDQTNH